MTHAERLVRELASLGNLFLILTLPELRRKGINFLALYALQRAVEVSRGYSQSALRMETGLKDYETSRACKQLAKGNLITLSPAADDARERLLIPTKRGKFILNTIMAAAGQRLSDSIDDVGRFRRIGDATRYLRRAHKSLRGPLQLSFFEKELRREYPKELRAFNPSSFK
jgi:DNA-binding MarR family transcriptional regulator